MPCPYNNIVYIDKEKFIKEKYYFLYFFVGRCVAARNSYVRRMIMKQITYRELREYKYQLTEDYEVNIPIKPDQYIDTDFIKLNIEGTLKIKSKYAWDGPSGPTIDTNNFMRGSLVHDTLYQLMREKHLDINRRDEADKLLRQHCREDGMSALRAWVVYKAVKWFGKKSASPSDEETTIFIAP
jgi:hypothetical protein